MGGALVRAVVPAYLLPAVQAGAAGMLTADEELVTASYTTIAVPSAAMAAIVVLATRVIDRRRGATVRPVRSALAAALAGAALAGVAATVLVLDGVFTTAVFGQAVPSAAAGGAVTAFAWAVRRNRAFRRRVRDGATGKEPRPSVAVRAAGVLR